MWDMGFLPWQDPATGKRVVAALLTHLDSGRHWTDSAAVDAALAAVRRAAAAQGQGYLLFSELAQHLRSPSLGAAERMVR